MSSSPNKDKSARIVMGKSFDKVNSVPLREYRSWVFLGSKMVSFSCDGEARFVPLNTTCLWNRCLFINSRIIRIR